MAAIQATGSTGDAEGMGRLGRNGFDAFVLLYEGDYLRYARARLNDPLASRAAVDRTLRRAEQSWRTLLQRRRPHACAWQILRATVDAACSASPAARPDPVRRCLSGSRADAALLHHQLGMPVKRAAALMGAEAPEVQADLLVVQRLTQAPFTGSQEAEQHKP